MNIDNIKPDTQMAQRAMPRFFDPHDPYQREEFISGRWTLRPDEVAKLFSLIKDQEYFVSDDDHSDLQDEYDEASKKIGKLQVAVEQIQTEVEGATEESLSDALAKKLLDICDEI